MKKNTLKLKGIRRSYKIRKIWVKKYTRRNGTRVKGHQRIIKIY